MKFDKFNLVLKRLFTDKTKPSARSVVTLQVM